MVDELPSARTSPCPGNATRPCMQPFQESAQHCGGSECLAPRRVRHSALDPSAAPWLSAARSGATAYSDSVSGPVQAQRSAGSVQVSRRRYRKRGSRGRGALERRKRDRPRLIAAVGTGQRAGTRRSSSDSRLCDILVAVQTQGEAIQSLAASVGRLAGAVHAQQRRRADSPPQRESGVDAQPDQQLIEHVSQQLVQMQCSVQQVQQQTQQTSEVQQRMQEQQQRCDAQLQELRGSVIGLDTDRQQVAQEMAQLDRRLDVLTQTVGARLADMSGRVNTVRADDGSCSRCEEWRESTDDSIVELQQSRLGLQHRVIKLENSIDALSGNLDHFLGPFSR